MELVEALLTYVSASALYVRSASALSLAAVLGVRVAVGEVVTVNVVEAELVGEGACTVGVFVEPGTGVDVTVGTATVLVAIAVLVLVGIDVNVLVGGTAVAVSVGGTAVAVSVAGTAVSVGGTAVSVGGGIGVSVGAGTGVSVGTTVGVESSAKLIDAVHPKDVNSINAVNTMRIVFFQNFMLCSPTSAVCQDAVPAVCIDSLDV